jgi:hypothetical protein
MMDEVVAAHVGLLLDEDDDLDAHGNSPYFVVIAASRRDGR